MVSFNRRDLASVALGATITLSCAWGTAHLQDQDKALNSVRAREFVLVDEEGKPAAKLHMVQPDIWDSETRQKAKPRAELTFLGGVHISPGGISARGYSVHDDKGRTVGGFGWGRSRLGEDTTWLYLHSLAPKGDVFSVSFGSFGHVGFKTPTDNQEKAK